MFNIKDEMPAAFTPEKQRLQVLCNLDLLGKGAVMVSLWEPAENRRDIFPLPYFYKTKLE